MPSGSRPGCSAQHRVISCVDLAVVGVTGSPVAPQAWHALSVGETMVALGSHSGGLTSGEAVARLAAYGPNRLPAPPRRSLLARLFAQIHNLLIYVLLASAAIAALIGPWRRCAGHPGRGRRQCRHRLRPGGPRRGCAGVDPRMIDPTGLRAARRPPGDGARRSGRPRRSRPARGRRPGPRRPAADPRPHLQIEEAALTGESVPVEKADGARRRAGAALGDRGPWPSPAPSWPAATAPASQSPPGRHRARPDQRPARRGRDAPHAARSARWTLRPPDHPGHPRGSRPVFLFAVACARLRRGRRVHGRGRPRGRGDPGGPAGGDDHHAGDRRAADGAAPRHHPPPARGRGAGLGHASSAPTRPARSPATR